MNSDFRKYTPIILSLLLVLSILLVFCPVSDYEFLNFDDNIYVTDNVHVCGGLSWESVKWALGATEAGFWHPLTWLSLMLDNEIFHLNAGGYHWTNVLLHIANTLLLFFVLRRMTGALWRSGFVAALFAIHPLHVESVTWIAERKDVLSGFFWTLTLWTYARYVELPGINRYLTVLLCFVLGLMSKPMAATLPVVLLLLDYWPLRRLNAANNQKKDWTLLILEKLPLAVCALVVIIITCITEHQFGAISDLKTISLPARVSNALVSYLIYIEKMFYPVKLAAYYPHPGIWPLSACISAIVALVLLTAIFIYARKRRPYLLVGWFWYLITLLPVIGFVQLGTMARADRYTYIPFIGLFIAGTWGSYEYLKQIRYGKSLLICSALSILLAFIVTARLQVEHWQNDFTLFQHAVNMTDNNFKAYHGLGMAYHKLGDDDQAIKNIRRSLSIKPDSRAHIDLGVVYMAGMRFIDAEREFAEALRLKPGNIKAHNNLGAALASQGNYDEAIPLFQEALRLDPNYEGARLNLKNAIESRNHSRQRLK